MLYQRARAMNKLNGKEFEALLLERASHLEDEGILNLRRYGVQAMMVADKFTGKAEWMIIKSFPDFTGVIAPHGRELIMEAKVCSDASYPLRSTDKKNRKQITHMLERARFGSLCYLIIHFNERVLMRRTDEAVTVALRVRDEEIIWREYEYCQRHTINREEALMHGTIVPWNLWSKRASKFTPDLRTLIDAVPQPELLLT